ncbi:unnamed protein product, partial [Mesorhabditis belari]|uniref:mitogen-activated protein kinase kinase n=1 Tax=Mesorhabditis belari TaxID=2138241 RepID=A0AAF3ES54_9BILA
MFPRFALPRLDFNNTENRIPTPPPAEASSSAIGSPKDISQIDYIRKFISDRLVFPEEGVSRQFTYDDLEELCFLGQGTFGRVSKMVHRQTGKIMAVKKVRLLTNQGNEQETNKSMQRLRIEVEAIKKASNCEQIVQFFGVTFHEFFDEKVLGSVAVSTIKALDHLKNEMHIIHRDVKPSNILLDRRGLIKLCDFGISGYLVDSIAQTMDAGCRPYMAPERLNFAKKGYDIRADVWSLGITMIEVATGKFPFPNFLNLPLFAQLNLVVHGDPPLLITTNYEPLTINFVNGCLIKEAESRPNFTQLMDTDYYRKYANLKDFAHLVADYVNLAMSSTNH